MLAFFGKDEVKVGVPDAAGDGGVGEDAAEPVDIAVEFAEVLFVVAFAALVIDDEDLAVGAADDAVGSQVFDAVIIP